MYLETVTDAASEPLPVASLAVEAKHDRGPGGIVTFGQVVRKQTGEAVVKGQIKVLMNMFTK